MSSRSNIASQKADSPCGRHVLMFAKIFMFEFHHHTEKPSVPLRLVSVGFRELQIQAILGHSTLVMSLKYVALTSADLIPASQVLDQLVQNGRRGKFNIIEGDSCSGERELKTGT